MSRRLVVCCDGTWNTPDDMRGDGHSPTNVTKVALGVAHADAGGTRQLLYYHPGVGTRPSERVRGGAFGYGLSRDVRDCYRWLVDQYEPGDELYFLGFSRGAFTARSAVGLVRNCGILRPEHRDRVDDAYRLYRSRTSRTHPSGVESQIFRRMYSQEPAEIRFIGVWDTVGALGIPTGGLRAPIVETLWGFHDTQLSSHVRSAHQALAIDEQRGPFEPALWTQQPDAAGQVLEQVWFAGVHCDVGGGYADCALSEIPLLWIVRRAAGCGLAFEPDRFQVQDEAPDDDSRRFGARTAPDAMGAIHESRKGLYRLLRPHRRTLADRDGQSVASSAVRRMLARSDYRPPSLGGWVAARGRVTAVLESPVAVHEDVAA
jgi:uncharacterized protein (DUF2235 family)